MGFDDSFVSRVKRAIGMARIYRNPFNAYRHRFTHPDAALVTHRLRNGPTLTVRAGPADIRIINEIWLARCYEQDPRIVPHNGWTVVDVGAHKGIYSARVLHLAPNTHVFSYEPDPDNFACLQANVGRRATIRNAAVGSDGGVATLYRVPEHGGLHTIVAERARARGRLDAPLEVKKVSLHQVVGEAHHVDLLKLDVEGAEYDLILGSQPGVFDNVDRVVLEYDAVRSDDPSVSGRDVAARLRQFGYTVDEGLRGVAKGYGGRVMTAIRSL
jgi:FkbM family methyltransferase